MASHGEAYCLSAHCVIKLRVRPHLVPSLTISSSLPLVFPSMPGKQTQPSIDFWLDVHILLCPVTSTNLTNTNLISNNRHCGAACQVRCALQRLYAALDLCASARLCVLLRLSHSVSFSIARSVCMLCFCFMWITSQPSSSHTHTSTHRVNLWPFFANTLRGLFVVEEGLCVGLF